MPQQHLTQTRSQSLIAPVGQIAQSVEQRIENPRVGGSIPSLGTMLRPAGYAWQASAFQTLSGLIDFVPGGDSGAFEAFVDGAVHFWIFLKIVEF